MSPDNRDIIDRLNSIPGLNYGAQDEKHLDALAVLSLPGHLRKTALAIIKLTKGDKEAISRITGKEIDLEERNLEELFRMGYLEKQIIELGTLYRIK
jgi:hypothetical protein